MNRWCVVAYNANEEIAVRYANANLDGSTGVYTSRGVLEQREVDPFESPLHQRLQLFFVQDEREAVRLRDALAERNAGIEYGIAQVQSVAISKPAKPVISKFTEKGLMPV